MEASYMSICHIQGPKLQLKCSEDLMCLFKCGLFCVKYQMNYKEWWNINTFLFLKTIQWSEFFLTILCVWFINVWFCQKFCNYFSVNSYWGSPKGWVNMLKRRSPIIWPPVSSEVCLRRHWVRGRPVVMTQLWPWAWWDAESLRSLHGPPRKERGGGQGLAPYSRDWLSCCWFANWLNSISLCLCWTTKLKIDQVRSIIMTSVQLLGTPSLFLFGILLSPRLPTLT